MNPKIDPASLDNDTINQAVHAGHPIDKANEQDTSPLDSECQENSEVIGGYAPGVGPSHRHHGSPQRRK